MKFVKRFLSMFLICCTLAGQIPALAAETPEESPEEDGSLLVILPGDGETSEETGTVNDPSEGSESSDPSLGDVSRPAEDAGEAGEAEEPPAEGLPPEEAPAEEDEGPAFLAAASYVPLASPYIMGKDEDTTGIHISFDKNLRKITQLIIFNEDENHLIIPNMIGQTSPRLDVCFDPLPVEILDRGTLGETPICYNWKNIKRVTTPSSLHTIAKAVFKSATFETIDLNNGLKSIGEYAFNECANLKSIRIPNSVETVGKSTFWGCSSLESAVWSRRAAVIPNYAFVNCTSLASVKIPKGVTQIGTKAFSGCTSLTDAAIPEGVPELSSWAFDGCTSLKTLYWPQSLTKIGTDALRYCPLEHIYRALYEQTGIAAAKFDESDGIFRDAVNVSDGGGASQAQMALAGGMPTLVWQEIPWGAEGPDARNGVLYASVYEGGWSAAEETGAPWYQEETAAPSTYEGDLPASASRVQVLDTQDCQAVLYTAKNEDAANVYGLFNSGYGWGEPVQLTDLKTGSVSGFSAVISGNTLEILVTRTTNGNYANAALALYEKNLSPSLSLSNVDYLHETLAPGDTATVTADVTNNGIGTVKSLTVSVGGGAGQPLEVSLLPGQTRTVYADYLLPENFAAQPAAVTVTSDAGASASGACTFTRNDVSVETLSAELGGDGRTRLTAVVANRGDQTISGYTVSFYREGEKVNEKVQIGAPQSGAPLAPGASAIVSLDASDLEEHTMIYAEAALASAGTVENLYGNNSNQTVVRLVREDQIRLSAMLNSGNARQVTVSDPLAQLTGVSKVFAASHDPASGKMTAVAQGTLSQGAVTFSRDLAPGWTLYFLDADGKPLCEKAVLS